LFFSKKILDNLGIKDKVFHITTDNAPNMTNGMDFLSATTNIKHQRCAANYLFNCQSWFRKW
jgi:galactitol-specific phosphotransferase system IIB component